VNKRGKSGKLGKITAVVGKAKYKVQWAGDDTASDTEYASTSLLVVDPPVAPDKAVGADGPAGAECDSDGGSDDGGDQFEAAREEGDHALKRAAFEVHARSLDVVWQDARCQGGCGNVPLPARSVCVQRP
jgi:hypothetical protein